LLCKLEADLDTNGDIVCSDKASFDRQLKRLGTIRKRHVKIITEGALLASVVSHEIHPNLMVISDDAGQFNVLMHALCWIHAERQLDKRIGVNNEQRAALEANRNEVWDLYRCLKLYKKNPNAALKQELSEQFDIIFQEKTCFTTMNHALARPPSQQCRTAARA
jgi:hypothetical protein